jgi:hypothetical protein
MPSDAYTALVAVPGCRTVMMVAGKSEVLPAYRSSSCSKWIRLASDNSYVTVAGGRDSVCLPSNGT